MGDFGVAIHPLKAKALLYGGRALRILRYNPYILTVEELYDGEFGYVLSVPPALQMLLDMHSLQTRDVLPDVYTDVVAVEEAADDGDTLIQLSPSGIIRRKVISYKHCDNFRWMTVPGGRQIHQGPKTFISIGIHSGVEVFYGLPHPQIALVHLHIDHSGYPKFLQFGGQVIKELIHLVKHKADEGFNGFVRSEGDARLCNRVVPADTPPLHNLTDFNCDRIPELQDKISLYLDAWWATPGREMRWTKSRQIGLCNIPQGFEFLLHNYRSNLSLSDLGYIVHNWGFVNTVGAIRKPTLKGDRFIFPMHPLLEFFYRFYIGFKPAFLGPYESFDHRSSPAVSHIYDVIKFDKRFFPYFAAWASSRGLFFLIPAVDMWIRRKHLFGWPHEIPSGIIPTSEICKTMTAAFADYIGCTEAIIGGDSIGCNREIKFFKHKCCDFYDDTNWVKLSEDFNGFKHYDGQWRFARWADGLCKQRYIRPGGINGEGLWHLRRWCYERMGATGMPIKDEQIGKFIPNKIFRKAEVDEVMGFVEKFNTKPNCWRKYMCGNPKKSNYDLIPNRCFGFYHKSGSVDRVQIPLISNLLPPCAC